MFWHSEAINPWFNEDYSTLLELCSLINSPYLGGNFMDSKNATILIEHTTKVQLSAYSFTFITK